MIFINWNYFYEQNCPFHLSGLIEYIGDYTVTNELCSNAMKGQFSWKVNE